LCRRKQVGVSASLPAQSGTITVIVMDALEPAAQAGAGTTMKASAAAARAIVWVRFFMLISFSSVVSQRQLEN
jgi:hypothetical protein